MVADSGIERFLQRDCEEAPQFIEEVASRSYLGLCARLAFNRPRRWETLVASRLIEYEMWIRLNARGLARSHGEAARQLLDRVATLELLPAVLARAVEPFPVLVRTLDALHLASSELLRSQHQQVELATYDTRMADAARLLGIPLFTA